MPDFDPLAILGTLNACKVDYLVVGGFAAVAHGSPLPTVDVDILVEPSMANLAEVSRALSELDARVRVEGHLLDNIAAQIYN